MTAPSDPVPAPADPATGEERPLFATLLWRYRMERGWTQEELAERAGLSPRGIRALEQGERSRPYKHTVRLLAETLGLQGAERDAFEGAARPGGGRERSGVIQLLEREPVRTNLPDEATPFIGRAQDIDEVQALLLRPGVRLVTLTGTGGIGKTRLALRGAAELLPEFEDGVYLVSLASVSDPAHVPSALATVLGLQERAGQEIVDTLKAVLATKHLLLVLDNLEHLLDAGVVLAELLESCRQLSLLVTSRSVLHLSREHEYPVSPLSVPDLYPLPALESLARSDAVALFVDRAQAVKPSFALTHENAPAVAEICHRLDGLPLAIELAAARTRLFPPPALLQRLSPRLPLLTGGPRDQPARLQTVRGAIDWSYHLLTPAEHTLFARLSVFAGGCTLEAVERVCMPEGDPSGALLQDLTALVEQSLVREVGEEEPRFTMLETIREYAAERLRHAGDEEMRRRHAVYYLSLAEEAAGELSGPRRQVWLDRLEAEHDNLRAALSWARDQGELDHGLRLAVALHPFWEGRGHVSEGRRWLDDLLAGSTSAAAHHRLAALDAAAQLARRHSAYQRAYELWEQSIDLAHEVGDQQTLVVVLRQLGSLAWNRGDFGRATDCLERALGLARALDDQSLICSCLHHLATYKWIRGDMAGALPLAQESLDLARTLRDQHAIRHALRALIQALGGTGDVGRARALLDENLEILLPPDVVLDTEGVERIMGLGVAVRDWGDYQGARRVWERAVSLLLDVGDREMAAFLGILLALLDREQGYYDRARMRLEECLTVCTQLDAAGSIAHALAGLGDVARDQGDAEGTIAFTEQSLALCRPAGDDEVVAFCLHSLAVAAWSQSDFATAERLLAEVAALRTDGPFASEFLPTAGLVALDQDKHAAAREAFTRGLQLVRCRNILRVVPIYLEGMAGVAAGTGEMTRAARLFGAAAALRQKFGTPLMPIHRPLYDRHTAAARDALGKEQFGRLWEEGQTMTVDQAIACALEEAAIP